MDLSFNNCFTDDERGLAEENSGDRIYCPHCREEVHRSTFYRHKTKYLEELSESNLAIFNGELHDEGEFAICQQKSEPLESVAAEDLEMFDGEFRDNEECINSPQSSEFLDEGDDFGAHFDQGVNETLNSESDNVRKLSSRLNHACNHR